jgi:hypothetical protein
MELETGKFKIFIYKNYKYLFYILSFIIPFFVFLRTMNPTSFGWDTTWFHLQVPILGVGQTTGFPLAFLTGKLFSFLPIGTMAYRLNMYSVFWGAATVFILFILLKNLLKNEYYIALISSIFFSFFRVFWFQTNRFEVYTLSTFLTVIIMLAGFYWSNTKSNKLLYLYYFLIGLSFTNHPISLFLSPAFILYPIYCNWKSVFKIKKIFIIILLIIAPNLLYLYIPIRSIQGYGNITTFAKFIDYITGQRWRSDFGFKSWEMVKKIFTEYISFLKGDFTIIVLIVFVIGLVYLVLKRRKFFILIVSLIVLNFIPILIYEKQATDFYLTTMVVFFSIPFACGLYGIKEGIAYIYNKFLKNKITKKIKFAGYEVEAVNTDADNRKPNTNNYKKNDSNYKKFVITRGVFFLVFFAVITIFPVNIFASNFKSMDASKGTYVYDYWYNVINRMENNSILLSNSLTSHVPIYILQFEAKKDIKIVRNVNLDDIKRIVRENLGKNNVYYTDSYLARDFTRKVLKKAF